MSARTCSYAVSRFAKRSSPRSVSAAGVALSIDTFIVGVEGVRFPKFDRGPEYPRDVVLNHRIGVLVKPGQPLEGVLLGRSATRIPSRTLTVSNCR